MQNWGQRIERRRQLWPLWPPSGRISHSVIKLWWKVANNFQMVEKKVNKYWTLLGNHGWFFDWQRHFRSAASPKAGNLGMHVHRRVKIAKDPWMVWLSSITRKRLDTDGRSQCSAWCKHRSRYRLVKFVQPVAPPAARLHPSHPFRFFYPILTLLPSLTSFN